MVGNDFVLPRTKLQAIKPTGVGRSAVPLATLRPIIVTAADEAGFDVPVTINRSAPHRFLDLLHRYSLGAFALLFLIVGSSAVQVGAVYWSAHISLATTNSTALRIPNISKHGPNAIVATDQLSAKLQAITNQSLSLTIGAKTMPVNSDTIKSWLQVVNDRSKGVTYIHVNDKAIAKSLTSEAAPYIKTPKDQVTLTRSDGSSQIIATGRDGTQLGNTAELVKQIGSNVIGAKGMQLNLPLQTLPFNAVSAASFDKLLEVNIASKQMWAYDKGQLTHAFPISAGAPETPTPIGQYKIYEKLAVQDMRGFNANGTRYFQPHVRWVNYFLPGGYAVHGNYWRPLSWFGAINSSHGCVSLPDDQAKWVYDWAPIGTTVITHT